MAPGVILGCGSSSSDSSGGTDAAAQPTFVDDLAAAFVRSNCPRMVECGAPGAEQCPLYSADQIELAVTTLGWQESDGRACETARITGLDCMATANCTDLVFGSACADEAQAYLSACRALLDQLDPPP